jgi:NitT/TauT family transport system ATP-binding protein
MPNQMRDNPTMANIIELRNVSQSYDGGKSFIIKDLNLLVEDKPDQGQFVVLLGMSGSGKSTLLRYIAGLQTPTSGEVLLNGKPVGPQNRASMVFQQYSSLPWMTVLDNVALPLRFQGVPGKERNERAMAMIKLVGLDGHQNKYAQYPTLSGGQLQRVAIARSLLADSSVILMDEPFGALDVKTRLQVQELLTNIWNEIHPTVIFVTHDISEAVYLGDEIYIMSSAPSKFVEHIHVDLPLYRNRALKRNKSFVDMVYHVEDLMVQIAEKGQKN